MSLLRPFRRFANPAFCRCLSDAATDLRSLRPTSFKRSVYPEGSRMSPMIAPDGLPYAANGEDVALGRPLPNYAGSYEELIKERNYWRNIYLIFGPIPCLVLFYYMEYVAEGAHPTREYVKGYDHLTIRKVDFPWGHKSLCHNKWVNRLPEGYEEMTEEEMAALGHH